jgi:hypothetical protein
MAYTKDAACRQIDGKEGWERRQAPALGAIRKLAHGRHPSSGRAHLRCNGVCAILLRMAVGEGRRTQLLRGVLDLCLLAVMQEGPAYGYEMTKRLRARGLSTVGEGSIYPLLGRLEREGLVETYRAASDDGGPPRKYYRRGWLSGGRHAMPSMPCSVSWKWRWSSERLR